jgi:6-phospho-3-hexuloisomerase
MRGDYKKMPTLGTSFEITALVFLDSVIGQLIMLTGTSEAELKSRGTNIE